MLAKLMSFVAPSIVAEAAPCSCEGVWSKQVKCPCQYVSGTYWVFRKIVRCDGCHLIYGTCQKTNIQCP